MGSTSCPPAAQGYSRGELQIEIEANLESACFASSKRCIYRAPEKLRRRNEEAYTPRVVSIGPFHHGSPRYEAMEKTKWNYLKTFIQRRTPKISIDQYLLAAEGREERARRCYAEPIPLSRAEFIKMLMLDGIFLIEFFFLWGEREMRDSNDPIYGRPWMCNDVLRDIYLLENQLPLFVIKSLYEIGSERNERDWVKFLGDAIHLHDYSEAAAKVLEDAQTDQIKHILDGVRHCLLPSSSRNQQQSIKGSGSTPLLQSISGSEQAPLLQSIKGSGSTQQSPLLQSISGSEQAPLLQSISGSEEPPLLQSISGSQQPPLLQSICGSQEPPLLQSPLLQSICGSQEPPLLQSISGSQEPPLLQSICGSQEITESICGSQQQPLRQQPANLKRTRDLPTATEMSEAGVEFKTETSEFLDIQYAKGVLQIHPITIDDGTESNFRNLILWEQCHYLHDGYFTGYVSLMDDLINTAEDVDLLVRKEIVANRLGESKAVANLFNNACKDVTIDKKKTYDKVRKDLIAHYHRRWNRWRATLMRDYFGNPWRTISVIGGVMLLSLTILQTIFSGLSL